MGKIKMKKFIARSISAKLIILFLIVSLLPFSIIGIFSYSRSKASLEKAIDDNMTSVLNSRVGHVENFITVSLDVVTTASSLSLFQDNLYNISKGIDVEKSARLLEDAMDDWASNSHVFYRAKISNMFFMVTFAPNLLICVLKYSNIVNESNKYANIIDHIGFICLEFSNLYYSTFFLWNLFFNSLFRRQVFGMVYNLIQFRRHHLQYFN